MESIIVDQIRGHLNKHQLLCDTQYGFRQKRSTVDMLSYITQWWNNALDTQEEIRVIALDIKKAFDRVWHKGLMTKLSSFGIQGDLHSWIASFLANRQQSVVLDGSTSSAKPISAGVPQGSILGPMLFLMFIDDLASNLVNDLHLFADDSTLHIVIKNANDRSVCKDSLQQDLNAIEVWATSWCVTFNASKTEDLIISRKRSQNHPPLYFMNNELEPTDSIKLLGVTITKTLSWSQHVSGIAKKTAWRLYILGRSRNLLPHHARIIIYKAYIRPLMEHASSIWYGAGSTSLRLLDRLQNKAIRLLRIDKPLKYGIVPLSHRRNVASLCVFYRHFFLQPSIELADILPGVAPCVRRTRSTTRGHPYCVQIPRSRTELHLNSYIPRTSRLWNSIPASAFPDSPDIGVFKKAVNIFLMSQTP